MRVLAIINQKGGCGKTTTAINLASVLAQRGFRTLLVDLDPQSHCAVGLAVPDAKIDLDIGDAMLAAEERPIDTTRLLWRVARNLDLAPSRMKLAGLEAARGGLADAPRRERRLETVLEQIDRSAERPYDVCVIDCPPSIGLLTYNALAAARDVIIPVETSFFSLQGATKQINTVRSLSRRLGFRIRSRLLGTIHDPSSALARDLLEELRSRFDGALIPRVIRADVAVKEASSFGMPVTDYAPASTGANDYSDLAMWLIDHLGIERASTQDISLRPRTRATEPDVYEPLFEDRPLERSRPAASMVEPKIASNVQPNAQQQSQAFMPEPPAALRPERSTFTSDITPSAPVHSTPDVLLSRSLSRPLGSVQRMFGVRESGRGMLFIQPLSLGDRIAIVGPFNDWNDDAHVMERNEALGVFELCVPLASGQHQYRLVVDGRGMPDPYNQASVENEFGEPNSVVAVHDARSPAEVSPR